MLLSADTKVRLALDRAAVQESFRTKDNDGHLHVSATPITKANVCPYYGREIVNWRELGLDAGRVYKLYRHPEELEKAAKTFNGKPLLFGHREVSAEAHDHEGTVGSVTGVYWKAPYLMGALDVWAGPAIEKIETGEAAELSAAYRYRADMTPGRTPEGEPYDGIMRDIDGNHVAAVPRGRAGRDVLVWDHAPITFKEFIMNTAKLSPAAAQTRGCLAMYLRPKLPQGVALDFDPFLKDVTAKNFRAQIPAVVLGVMRATKGKLAQDADIEDVAEVIEALAEILPPEQEAEVKEAVEGAEGGEVTDDADDAELRAMLKAKGLSDEEIDRICAMGAEPAAAADEKDTDKKDDKAMDAALIEARIRKATSGMVSKTAMDAALAAQAKTFREVEDARRAVRPWVGELEMAFDSAPAVLRQALTMLGKNVAGKSDDALMDILEVQPKPGDKPKAQPRVAQDAAAVSGFAARYPNAARIGHAA
jgi:hypothetical protein